MSQGYDTQDFLGTDTTPEQYACDVGVDPELLDREFPSSYDAYLRFGKLVPNWAQLAPLLGLRPQEVQAIRANLHLTDGMHEREVLKKWKSKKSFNAKYRQLVKAYLDVDREVAKAMCLAIRDYCGSQPPPTKQAHHYDLRRQTSSSTASAAIPRDVRYCITEVYHREECVTKAADPDTASGSIRPCNRWVGYKDQPRALRVHFLNPEVLRNESWTFDKNVLTTDTILAWATYWNSHADHYPRIAITEAAKSDAEIRVLFDSTQISWSKIGSSARSVRNTDEPTMVLNLNIYGMTPEEKRSMVLHEFGHALGLDHEHQRSDFWGVLAEQDGVNYRFIIGTEEMKRGNGFNYQQACTEHFVGHFTREDSEQSEYDCFSIMHYWFDKKWLLPEYRDLNTVRSHSQLSTRQKHVLEGVHTRDYSNGQLPADPSRLDYEVLNRAYMR